MRSNILLFALGALLLQQQPQLPDLRLALLALPAVGAAVFLRNDSRFALPLSALTALAAGFFWAALCAQIRLADGLAPELEGENLRLVGVIASLPQESERGIRFEFDVERVLPDSAQVPRHVSLNWYHRKHKDGMLSAAPGVRPGERWELTVRLRRPHGNANPHGFDYEAWLLERNIRATGYVRDDAANQRLVADVALPSYRVERLRQGVRERFRSALADAPMAGVLIALAIGDQQAIPRDQWQVFVRTGVNHLMSISGLHITMVSGLVFALVYGLWRRMPWLILKLPARKAAALAGAVAALGYGLLSGFAVPAQRTVYMVLAAACALWFSQVISVSRVLCLALLAVVLLDPWAVLSPGFWLSFGAVALMLFVTAARLASPHWLRAWGRAQWAVSLGLVPLLIALFQQVSLVSPIGNAFAIPIVSLVVAPLALLSAIPALDFLLPLAEHVMAGCFAALEFLSQLPEAMWQSHAPPAWALAAGLAGVVWTLMPRGFPARFAGVALLLPLFLAPNTKPSEGELWLTVLDVGQGLAVLARTENHALLYDTGPEFSPGADSGNRIIVPYLRASGIGHLDGLIVTHDDSDHSGGVRSVMEAVPTGWLASPLALDHSIVMNAKQAMRCFAGQSWTWDGVRFDVMHPSWETYADPKRKDNDRGCVLRIASSRGAVLLAADIEQRSELELIARVHDALHADVLIAPHHGAKTSSSEEFVQAVNPQLVIFAVGYRNPFGHPRPEVIERYRNLGAQIYRTDRMGAIEVRMQKQPAIETYRLRERRYWRAAGS